MDEARRYVHAIDWLWRAGLCFGGMIDLGCADGSLSVMLADQGERREWAQNAIWASLDRYRNGERPPLPG